MIMRKILSILLTSFALALTLISQNNITFAFTSKFQSQIQAIEENGVQYAGAARLSTAIRNLRLTSDRFIMLDTGDHFAGRFYRERRGEPDVELMNNFRYDAMLVGSSELSMGEDIFDNWAKFARFPLLISNLIAPPQCKTCRHIASYTTIERVGLTVGVFGLLPRELESFGRLPDRIGIDEDYVAVARDMVEILEEKCDIIILLSQLNIESNVKLAEEVCEIDLIIVNDWAGYEDEPIVIENEAGCITILGHAGERGQKLGVIQTTWDGAGKLEDYFWKPILLSDSIPLDPEVHEFAEGFIRPEERLSVGVSTVELDGRKAILLGAESNLGNFVADACKAAFPNAEIAVIPGGSIYGDEIIEPGNITAQQIREILPFGEKAVLLEIPGQLLKTILERAACNIENNYGGFMQISGASVRIDTSKSAQCIDLATGNMEREGSRVREIKIDGAKFEKDKTYKVVTTDFAAVGGFGYEWLVEIPRIAGRELSEILIEYIEASSPISPKYEGRIIIEP